MTGEDLKYKPVKQTQIKQAKFYCSPLDKFFNKGEMKKIKKGLLKRLKNVEGKNDEPLKAIED